MKRTFEVQRTVTVTLDESKFTPEFMAAFRKSFYDFETVEEHAAFIAEARATGVIHSAYDHLEGYGRLTEFGVKISIEGTDCTDISE